MIATTLDPQGRRVRLTEERWRHIEERHPEEAGRLDVIMGTVREPDRRIRGRTEDETWFLTEHAGPLPWLHVVVHYRGGEGWIVTAFRRASLPRR